MPTHMALVTQVGVPHPPFPSALHPSTNNCSSSPGPGEYVHEVSILPLPPAGQGPRRGGTQSQPPSGGRGEGRGIAASEPRRSTSPGPPAPRPRGDARLPYLPGYVAPGYVYLPAQLPSKPRIMKFRRFHTTGAITYYCLPTPCCTADVGILLSATCSDTYSDRLSYPL